MNSAVYRGQVRHCRYQPREHVFNFPLYMLGLDLDELEALAASTRLFALDGFAPLSLHRKDYLGDPTVPLKTAVIDTVNQLGGNGAGITRVMMLTQVRCFGFYFSPVNFYFCYTPSSARYLLAEVTNTPWRESHCYLVDLNSPQPTPKSHHVSPFMSMALDYHWHIQAPAEHILVHIENRQQETKLFEATLNLVREDWGSPTLRQALLRWPLMTMSIVRGIYWQALRLWMKAMPVYQHPGK